MWCQYGMYNGDEEAGREDDEEEMSWNWAMKNSRQQTIASLS